MDDPWKRLIVVGGMAKTGTTALATYIASHPDVLLTVDEKFWHLAEGNLIRIECGPPDWLAIDDLLEKNPTKRVVIKQPWISVNLPFLSSVMSRGGKVVICFREKEDLLNSWKKTTFIAQYTKDNPNIVYNDRLPFDLKAVDMGALRVDKDQIGINMAKPLAEFLGLTENGFDSDRIKKVWGLKTERDWMEKKAIWKDRMLKLYGPDRQGG